MFVMTVDQQGSRTRGDAVPALLDRLAVWAAPGSPGVRIGFDRTVGDEVQGVLDDADVVVRLTLDLLRLGGWTVGIGAGAVDEPLPAAARAGSGPAFVHARRAVERAKTRTRPAAVAVEGETADRAELCEGVLTLVASVRARRTDAGWAVVDAVEDGATQDAVAERLGITQQAVSQRLRTALWAEERDARPAAARLLEEAV
ncbi:hypothetical protein [Cellulomonas carbonis]|uniref:SatD family (SatD) n=1 Tax=Cellulomonas carbonis T26 TaxID=947969 RepID=A0A0A0BSI2_9CELL|nr:hypothetical protein [Cellulomonas carbonis]KGM10104.1 hypothetical protein N868_16675 [Cellulomonas carbonis T26]GGB94162.1 hypothetical protein GCM10010972_03550 [Cellulomonas carbonis]